MEMSLKTFYSFKIVFKKQDRKCSSRFVQVAKITVSIIGSVSHTYLRYALKGLKLGSQYMLHGASCWFSLYT